jgi:hypothetical protein
MVRLLLLSLLSILCFTMCSTRTNTEKGVAENTNNLQATSDEANAKTGTYKSIYRTYKQRNQFMGTWCPQGTDSSDDCSCDLEIDPDTSVFCVVNNQLGLQCKNVSTADTLYLYVLESDQGQGFMGPKFFPPKPNSLFAKCFIVDSTLRIYYTQKLFRDNIETLELNTILYKNSENGIDHFEIQ